MIHRAPQTAGWGLGCVIRPGPGVLMRRSPHLAGMVLAGALVVAAALILPGGVRPAHAAADGSFGLRLLETPDVAVGRTPVEPRILVQRLGTAATDVVLT